MNNNKNAHIIIPFILRDWHGKRKFEAVNPRVAQRSDDTR